MGLGIDPTNDYVFRLLYGDPANSDLLIHLLNAILQLPSPITDVEILNPFIEQEFDHDKLAVLDIKAKDSDGRLLNVEMQTSVTHALRERLVYYAACLFTSQLSEGDTYAGLCPTIGICILSANMFPELSTGHLQFVLSDLRHGIELTRHFQIHTVELPKYNAVPSLMNDCRPLEKLAYLFRHASELDGLTLRNLLPEAPFQKTIGILEMISRTPAQRDIYEARQKAARDEAWKIQEARREGQMTGREEGLRIGCIRQIRLLQQILNDRPSQDHELIGVALSELDERIANLQARLTSRGRS